MKFIFSSLIIFSGLAFADVPKIKMSPGSTQTIEVGEAKFEVSCAAATGSKCKVVAVAGCHEKEWLYAITVDEKRFDNLCYTFQGAIEVVQKLRSIGQCAEK